MKEVLVICDLFPPAFGPRMGYLCKYLKKAGWNPVVLTEALSDQTFVHLAGICPTYAMSYYSFGKGMRASLQRAVFLLLDLLLGYKNRKMYREAVRLIRAHSFSLILCSAYRTFPLCATAKVARRYRIPWIADLRDIIEQYAGYEYISRNLPALLAPVIAPVFARSSIGRRNRAISRADYLTTVSPWHVEVLRRCNPRVALIYNGYDAEIFYPRPVASDRFIITYTGRIFSLAMRDPSLLFMAIKRLSAEGILSPSYCRIEWYVDDASWGIVEKEAARHGVQAFMDNKGLSPSCQIPAILNRSSVLLLLSNKSSDADNAPKGIMTTKLFEYLAVEKPILCVRSDESHVAELIRSTRSGLAAVEVDEVYGFILDLYNKWKARRTISLSVDREQISAFSRERQAQRFIDIFKEIGREKE